MLGPLELAAELKAVHLRHHAVEQHQVRDQCRRNPEPPGPAGGGKDGVLLFSVSFRIGMLAGVSMPISTFWRGRCVCTASSNLRPAT